MDRGDHIELDDVAVSCPQCGVRQRSDAMWIRTHAELVCTGCGERFEPSHDAFADALEAASARRAL